MVDFIAVIDAKKYSSLTRLLRISAYALRFIWNLKEKLSGNSNRVVQELSITAVKQAELYWIKTSSFEDEVKFLTKKSQLLPPGFSFYCAINIYHVTSYHTEEGRYKK